MKFQVDDIELDFEMEHALQAMETGICVKVTQKLDGNGNRVCTAVHKRDSQTAWRLRLQTKDPMEALTAWIERFTGKASRGFIADFKVAARGTDHEGYYYVLVVTDYN